MIGFCNKIKTRLTDVQTDAWRISLAMPTAVIFSYITMGIFRHYYIIMDWCIILYVPETCTVPTTYYLLTCLYRQIHFSLPIHLMTADRQLYFRWSWGYSSALPLCFIRPNSRHQKLRKMLHWKLGMKDSRSGLQLDDCSTPCECLTFMLAVPLTTSMLYFPIHSPSLCVKNTQTTPFGWSANCHMLTPYILMV